MRRLGIDHVLGVGSLLVVAVVEVENVQHSLRIVLLLLLADIGRQQEPLPCFRHSLKGHKKSSISIGGINATTSTDSKQFRADWGSDSEQTATCDMFLIPVGSTDDDIGAKLKKKRTGEPKCKYEGKRLTNRIILVKCKGKLPVHYGRDIMTFASNNTTIGKIPMRSNSVPTNMHF